MNKAKRLLALLLAALLCAMALPVGWAEEEDALGRLLQGVERPASYTLDVNPAPAEDSAAQQRTVTVDFTSDGGEVARAVIALSFEHFKDLDDAWQQRAEAYAEVVRDAAQGAEVDPEAFAARVGRAIDAMHRYNERLAQAERDARRDAATRDEDVGAPAASAAADPLPTASVLSIQVVAPYYEVLQRGSRGDAVVRLQRKLIELGFLEGDADGQFGPGTEKGVVALQEHVRTLEQEQIDLMPAPTAPPTPTATPAAPDGTPNPDQTPEPAPTAPPKPEPRTALDGIAGVDLQAYLFSDSFSIASAMLRQGDEGAAVRRLQNRLARLGYLAEAPTGTYGPATARAVRLFQHYAGGAEDGVAAREWQQHIYDEAAARAPYPMLSEGSRGDEVKDLQRRMKLLGFMVGDVDGTYGKSTVQGVKNLQEYLYDREVQRLTREAAARAGQGPAESPDGTPAPTAAPEAIDPSQIAIVVDGTCDPILQEAFYGNEFPAIPDLMKSGSGGGEVKRLQRRLYDLEYLFTGADGSYGDNTVSAVTEFQSRNGLNADGQAGEQTIARLFSESAKRALKPYLLKISTSKQRVYVYAPDENEEYTRLVRTMKCSTGLPSTPTPKGTFQGGTGPGARWHYFKKFNCWAQYAYYIEGDILFHSVLYGSKGGRVTKSSVWNLGSKASHGCVRLSVDDAKWLWNNCPRKTKVVVY